MDDSLIYLKKFGDHFGILLFTFLFGINEDFYFL
jgi:hypothetical protein